MSNFPRGSEWRRWDLHIHTPETVKNDNFEGDTIDQKWEKFYADVESYIGDGSDPMKNIAVIGITDYLSIDNYRKVISDNKLPNSVLLILPNIEMRVLPTASSSPVNIHFIFDPDIADSIEDRFFSNLKFNDGSRDYNATKSQLIALGKKSDPKIDDDSIALKKGIEQFVPPFDSIRNIFSADKDLRNQVIIAVSNKTNDGVSGATNHRDYSTEDGSSQLSMVRQSILKGVDFIFSATPNDINYYLGKKERHPPDKVIEQCGSLKPCVHGCDAHENARVFEPDQNRYCWIKSDPTFNGLRQITYEPDDRVRISDTMPDVKPPYQVIDSISIKHDDFQSSPIVFNDKLNCIIGGKSTGKSLLLHNLARAIDITQVEEKCDVIAGKNKGKQNKSLTLELDTNVLSVNWVDGGSASDRKIIYIPQKYLNSLVDSEQATTEIDEIIEKVILEGDGENKRLLRESKLNLNSRVDAVKAENTNNMLEIIRRHIQASSLSDQIAEIGGKDFVKTELGRLQKQREQLSLELNLNDADVKSYDAAVANIDLQEQLIKQTSNEVAKIEQVTTIVQACSNFIDLSDETMKDVASIIDDIVSKSNEAWNISKVRVLEDLKKKIAICETSVAESVKIRDSLKSIIENSNAIQELVKKINIETEKLKQIEALEKSKSDELMQMQTLIGSVSDSYVNLRLIYESFATDVNTAVLDIQSDLSFSVQIPFRSDDFLRKWTEIYGARSKSVKNREVIDVENFSDILYTKELLSSIISKTLSGDLTRLKEADTETALRNILGDWYNIKYIVTMDNDAIETMSPGKKALVLLKLLIERADSGRPILIDQPEDDLDNRSVYDQLIGFIKQKKIDRQIIIVTHNANIVVAADAEEVIVANQLVDNSNGSSKRFFEYRSGSIENDMPVDGSCGAAGMNGELDKQGIQQHICDILEGGKPAFEQRKNKYQHLDF